jgi:hypothetical protein
MYADAGPDGAYWFMTLSEGQGHIEKKDWDTQRFGMICESVETWANIKENIEVLCANSGLCTFEVKQKSYAFYDRLQSTAKKAKK